MVKFTEIYCLPKEYDAELATVKSKYDLRETFVNPKFIIAMKENVALHELLCRSDIIDGLNKKTRFTEISVSTGGTHAHKINVIGHPSRIIEAMTNAPGALK